MPKESLTEDVVYKFVCKHPGTNTYCISKRLKMTGGRVRHALKKLKEIRLVKFKFERNNPRIQKLTFPVDTLSLMPKEIKRDLKKIKI